MFGYIKPNACELKVKHFEMFRAVYCSLCKEISRKYGVLLRLTLNYDFVFIALLALSQQENKAKVKKCGCFIKPFTKKCVVVENDCVSLSADLAIIMLYYKLLDSIADKGFWEKVFACVFYPFVKLAYNKARKLQPNYDQIIHDCIIKQATVEKTHCSTDAAAEPTAIALSKIVENFSPDHSLKRVCSRIGYLIGRFIYLIDALDDLEKDLKTHNFNPFICKYIKNNAKTLSDNEKNSIRLDALNSLTLTISEIKSTFDLMEFKNYKPIIENIVYQGFDMELKRVLSSFE